ncbi:MAG TPA: hypothetical protein VKY26_06510 [Actinomycetota bacterium]|nr:hypothetical protein [Actinomycetota bacterium]
MRKTLARALACLGGLAVGVGVLGASPVYASGGSTSCAGGSIAGGNYRMVYVTGICFAGSGSITAQSLVIAPGAWLIAAFGNAEGTADNVTANSISVGAGSVLILGCEPSAFTCINDPGNSYSSSGTVYGGITALNASAVIVHNSYVQGNVSIQGGGGGTACNFGTGPLMGSPFYDDVEDSTIGGSVSIQGVHTCWLGLFRNTIYRNVAFNNNTDPYATAFFYPYLPDGNELATNLIGGSLNCIGNVPPPQFGDSGGSPNAVYGSVSGQCVNVVY